MNETKYNADLHTHTYYSDGEDSPFELVKKARKAGLKYLAITDHNTVNGIEEAIFAGKKFDVIIIPGVEVATRDGEILGYMVDYKKKDLKKELRKAGYNWNESTKNKIKALRKRGLNISYRKLKEAFPFAVNNYNIGNLILYLTKFLAFPRDEAVKLVVNTKVNEPKQKELTTIQAIKLIRKYNGIPILAHPWINEKLLDEGLIKKLIKHGLKGIEIEAGEGYNSLRTRKIVNKITKLARKFNLILTKGSDYHGELLVKYTNRHQLGKYNCSEKTVKQIIEQKFK